MNLLLTKIHKNKFKLIVVSAEKVDWNPVMEIEFLDGFLCFEVVLEVITKFVYFEEILTRIFGVECVTETFRSGDEAEVELLVLAWVVNFEIYVSEIF